MNCVKGKCIHGSTAKSIIGTMEAEFWKMNGAYKYIDKIICCSEFLKTKMDTNPLFGEKTIALHNFVERVEPKTVEKKDYVLYFGRFSEEKGINTLVETCNLLPDIQFVFAGSGPLEDKVNQLKNVKNVGFQTGEALDTLIREAKFSICPSEVYENCPFSVMESRASRISFSSASPFWKPTFWMLLTPLMLSSSGPVPAKMNCTSASSLQTFMSVSIPFSSEKRPKYRT